MLIIESVPIILPKTFGAKFKSRSTQHVADIARHVSVLEMISTRKMPCCIVLPAINGGHDPTGKIFDIQPITNRDSLSMYWDGST